MLRNVSSISNPPVQRLGLLTNHHRSGLQCLKSSSPYAKCSRTWNSKASQSLQLPPSSIDLTPQYSPRILHPGSTLGSRKDLLDATAFIEKHRIVPEVSHVLRGLDEVPEGFNLLRQGAQFGKIVVKFPGREPDGSVRL